MLSICSFASGKSGSRRPPESLETVEKHRITLLIIEGYMLFVCFSRSQITRLVHYTAVNIGGCEDYSNLHDEEIEKNLCMVTPNI